MKIIFLSFLLFSCVSEAALVTNNFTETSEAFPNPMKGFMPSRYPREAAFRYGEYTSTFKHYIPYTDLENNVSDGVDKIKNWCNYSWANIEKHNSKVIPRVVIYYPGTGQWWPSGVPNNGTPERWTTEELKTRLISFIQKLGAAWDNDPRVCAIEMGLWGSWGEQHIWPDQIRVTNSQGSVSYTDRMPASFQQTLGEAFSKSFTNKIVMVRYQNTFTNYDFGYHWDSFAQPYDIGWANWMTNTDIWTSRMLSGEVAYDWGDQSNLGGNPDGTLSSTKNTQYVIGMIRSTHMSSLGWISEYTKDNPTISINAALMQKELGYRFFISQAVFEDYLPIGSKNFAGQIQIKNIGNAPFYYPWPICFYLLNSNKTIISKYHADSDIRACLPGNTYNVDVSFPVPSYLKPGIYTLAISINDPAGDVPSLRFANLNYFRGGLTPIGKFGYGQFNSTQNLGPFDTLKSDNTLFYVVHQTVPSLGALSIPGKVYGSAAFFLTAPASTSSGEWSYSSGNTNVAVINGNTVMIVGAGNSVITATQAASGRYASASKSATLSVSAAVPSLSGFTIPFKIYGDAPFTLTAPSSPSGGSISYMSSNPKVATVSGNTVTIRGAGTAVITATQAASGNYSTKSVSATLTVAKASQTITFMLPATNNFILNGLIPLNGFSTSNLPITYTSRNGKILTISRSNAVMKSKGTTTITASQAGNANYKAAAPVASSITLQ